MCAVKNGLSYIPSSLVDFGIFTNKGLKPYVKLPNAFGFFTLA